MKRACICLAVLVTSQVAAGAGTSSLATLAERTQFRETGRYREVEELCEDFARTWPRAVRCAQFGRTPEGRTLRVLIASTAGALTPESARTSALPVMLVQGGIHAGEIEGKDAGFIVLRELLQRKVAVDALNSFVLVFVPVFNVDGHERFGPWNRLNQNGPAEKGWRTTAQNLNLNRDYAKADAPEMHAMLRLLAAWDPILYVDLHTTDGAQFEHDVANLIEPLYLGDPALQPTGREILATLNHALEKRGSLPLDFYPSLNSTDDPASGFSVGAYPPRFSTGYWALRNRFALLVETHSWKDYPKRVAVTRNILVELAAMIAERGREWTALAREADARAAGLAGELVTLDFDVASEPTRTLAFHGYAYTREPSSISGALVTRYDPSRPQIWRIPLREQLIPKITTRAPRGGYIVPPAQAEWLAERLSLHGIRFERLARGASQAAVETFRAKAMRFSPAPFEGRTTATLEGEWNEERRDVLAGSLFVPIAQPKARLVLALLEPRAPDSFAAWGFFNGAFEQKEYAEPYVAEQMAREMLAKDPELGRRFAQRVAEDAAFARDPAARLDFFHRLHPSWDERFGLYPVYRTAARP